MRQIDLSSFTQYAPESPVPPSDSDPHAALVDGTLAQSLNNDFIARQQELLRSGSDAFYAKQGADALSATPSVLDQLQALRDQLLDTTVNPRQRQILAQSLDNHLIVSRGDIARHAAQQSLMWQHATAQNRLDLLQKQAGFDYGDPESIANYAEAGRSAALHQASIAGLPVDSDESDERASNAASTIWRSAIEAALAKNDNASSITLYGRAANSLSAADAAILGRYIEGARERETGRNYAEALPLPESDPASAVDVAKTLADLDTAHEAARAQNVADWPDDPSQRATNQHFIDIRFGEKKRNVLQAKADLNQALTDWLNQSGSDGWPQTERPPLAIWTKLNADQQRATDIVLTQNAQTVGPAIGIPTDQQAEPMPQPSEGRGTAPPVEPPSNSADLEKEFQNWEGRLVRLPDGSPIPNPYSPNGYLMSPFADLSDVTAAGRKARPDVAATLRLNPEAVIHLYYTVKGYLGQGGTFDYQRRRYPFGKGGFTQLRQFRDVSNFNVGLFCQQAGLSLEQTLGLAGAYALMNSSNRKPDELYALDPRTKYLIELGYQIGQSGAYNSPRHSSEP